MVDDNEPNQNPNQDSDQDKIEELAAVLIEARTQHQALGPLPDRLLPSTPAEAAAVDDHVAATSGWELKGWKIGCTSDHAQEMLGAPGPFAGRVYSLFHGDTSLGPDELIAEPNLEGEFAFTLGADLAPRQGGHDRESILAAITNVRPSMEIVGGRFAQFVGTPLLALVADAGANSHLIVGEPADVSWDPASLAATSATMEVDGARTGGGVGADVLGGPIEALEWLVDHLGGRGITLRAGQVVTTGTATQVSALPVGSTATATLKGLGSVSLSRH